MVYSNHRMSARTTSHYKNGRFPSEIIAHAVWLYHRFSLSFREVKELSAERGVTVSHEAVRLWCFKSGQVFAEKLRHRRGHPGGTWCRGGNKKAVDKFDDLEDATIRNHGGKQSF